MSVRLVECIPNFSVGRDIESVEKLALTIKESKGVKLLHVDPGYDANRTVFTFIGDIVDVCNCAFKCVEQAAKLIDMRYHEGEHPRIGATDVLPLVPISGVTLDECVIYARELSQKIGEQLHIPVYCYEQAAFYPNRKNLAVCRSGEYEGLAMKMSNQYFRPDFGPAQYNWSVARTGATVVGARDFLVAVNFNLDTQDITIAKEIAKDVRERGRVEVDMAGERVTIPGKVKCLKAIGWYMEKYGFAQVSCNIVNIHKAPLYVVWQAVCEAAKIRGCKVTGTEIIGLIPEAVLKESGLYFASKTGIEGTLSADELVDIAINEMNLNQITPFIAQNRILEKLL